MIYVLNKYKSNFTILNNFIKGVPYLIFTTLLISKTCVVPNDKENMFM